ncbi:uncharacterized protein LOC119767162 [Culex quinquefasciatus]|nr:uncharacterized protein LOC119767162 [Culex quinquefasciatus]XP_038110965.1 uncharacterized protein LOC119767162 [Culex quinquefasciatus]
MYSSTLHLFTSMALVLKLVSCKIIVDVVEEALLCDDRDEPLPLPAADFTGLEFELNEDDVMCVSGTVTVREDYEAPLGTYFYTKHLERGQWRPGVFARIVKDFCPDILNPREAWYFITKTLNQTYCPYRKGHVEVLDRLKFGTYGVIVPFHMLGEWKLYFEVTAKRNGQMIKECIMRRVFLTDG